MPEGPVDIEGSGDDSKASSSSSSSSSNERPKKGDDKSKFRRGLAKAGESLNRESVERLEDLSRDAASRITSMKRGGTKRGKGPARLHKGEMIMPARKKSKRNRGRMSGRA